MTPALHEKLSRISTARGKTWEDLMDALDANADRYVANLRELIRTPSVSSTGEGVAACGNLLSGWLERLGVQVTRSGDEIRPILHGRTHGPENPGLLVYSHYDTQPALDEEAWDHPPFSAHLVNGRIIGRGATDAKGNVLALLAAVEVLQSTMKELPLSIHFLFDGEEEIGSPSLPTFVAETSDLRRCDAVISMDGGIGDGEIPKINLGGKGILHVALTVRGPQHPLHSSKAPLVPNPAWRLIAALNAIKDPSGRVNVGGFYDRVEPPSPEEIHLLEEYPWDDDAVRESLGIASFVDGRSGMEALVALLYEPTCNLSSISSGYQGEGINTAVPASAHARLDLRLVPAQDPIEVFDAIRAHLAREGFEDLEISNLGHLEPHKTPFDSPLVEVVVEAATAIYGTRPAIKPIVEASGRQGAWLGERLGVPGLQSGIGPPRWNGHAPNEFITVEHFIRGIKYICAILLLVSDRFGNGTPE